MRFPIKRNSNSTVKMEVYKKLKTLEHKLNAIVINRPRVEKNFLKKINADIALIHGNFGVVLCNIEEIKENDLHSIKFINKNKIVFYSGKEINNPWTQIEKYSNLLVENTGNKYHIATKIILPHILSSKLKKYLPEIHEKFKNETLFKDDIEKSNFEKLFLGIPSDNLLSKEDVKYLCEILGIKIDEDKLNNISVYRISTPQGIFYYDKKVISVLKDYKGGLKIIRGLAGTGKTITLLQFILYKASELRKELKKLVFFVLMSLYMII